MTSRRIIEIPQKIEYDREFHKIKVCAYVRVSTDNVGQTYSFQNQVEYYEGKLSANPDYDFCGVFSDSGLSGSKENRPGFLTMIEKAKLGEIDLIITKSISRFARNTLMLLRHVRELRSVGVGVIFEEQNINTLSVDGELMLTILAAIAEEERKSVCSNIQWSVQNKYKQGIVQVDTNRLLGFDKGKDGKLIINEAQAKIVRYIYKRYVGGDSAYYLAKVLNAKGVPTYAKQPWSSHRIMSIISNEKNKGDCLLQKSFINNNGRQTMNNGDKSKYYVKNSHPAIVSRSIWDRAQAIRARNKRPTYPCSGKIKCAYCGATLIRCIHKEGYISWVCGTYLHQHKSACIGMRIPEKKLLEMTKDMPIILPMVLEDDSCGKRSNPRTKKNYRLIPLTEYRWD